MSVLQAKNLESIRDHDTLLLVEGSRDSLKALEALQSSVTTLCLVGHHSVKREERAISDQILMDSISAAAAIISHASASQ